MKRKRKWLWGAVLLLFVSSILMSKAFVYAKEYKIPYEGGEETRQITLRVGDTGQFEIPEEVTYEGVQAKVLDINIEISDYDDDYGWYDDYVQNSDCILRVDKEGKFVAMACGKTEVTIMLYLETGENKNYDDDDDDYNDYDDDDYNYDHEIEVYYEVTVIPDMSEVNLTQSSQTKYVEKNSWGYYYVPAYTFTLDSDIVLNEDNPGIDISFSSSNSKIGVSGELYNNVITLYPSDKGSTTVTIKICDKTFKVKIKTIVVRINKNSLLLAKGQSSTLKISGVTSGIKWSSGDKKIATVSSKGIIKAKKTGNVVIKAKIGDVSLGCAVSVVTSKRLKVVKAAIQIAKTCTYSQPKRMQSKYYDCSSLVWKAYSKYEQNFGNKSYAPVAADLGKWCAERKKTVKGGVTSKNVQKMIYNPGDLYFLTGSNNGRYKGIYHVEMISGYVCYGFDYSGKPILELNYVNRSPGKYYGGMVGQP